jgi:hypothetical protein
VTDEESGEQVSVDLDERDEEMDEEVEDDDD